MIPYYISLERAGLRDPQSPLQLCSSWIIIIRNISVLTHLHKIERNVFEDQVYSILVPYKSVLQKDISLQQAKRTIAVVFLPEPEIASYPSHPLLGNNADRSREPVHLHVLLGRNSQHSSPLTVLVKANGICNI